MRRHKFSIASATSDAISIKPKLRSLRGSNLHPPAPHGAIFDRLEDHVLDEQAKQNHRQQAGEDVRYQQLVLVLEDVPADAT